MSAPARPRRVTILVAGTRGDVQPLLAVARGMDRLGAVTTLATHRCFESLVRGAGVRFEALPGDIPAAFATDAGRRYMSAGRNTLRWAMAFNEVLATFWEPMLEAFVELTSRADAVVVSSLTRPAALAATARGIPWVGAFLGPNYTTRRFAHRLAPQLPLGALYNRASHRLVPLLLLPRSSSAATAAWMARRHLPKAPAAPAATIYGFSPRIVPPPDRAERAYVTGYWFLDAEPGSALPPELEAFLAGEGRPKVAVSFSSIQADARTTARLWDAITRATALAGTRTVVVGGWTEFGGRHGEDTIVTGPLPHDVVFPRMDLVVHHGGAGSSAAALRAGVPSVVVPFCADQFFWADRLRRAGVAPRAVPAKTIDPGRLAAAMRAALDDAAMRARARELGSAIDAEHGAEVAARAVLDALVA